MSDEPPPHALKHAREGPSTQHPTPPSPSLNARTRTLPPEEIDVQSDPIAAQFQQDLQSITGDKSAGQETEKNVPALPGQVTTQGVSDAETPPKAGSEVDATLIEKKLESTEKKPLRKKPVKHEELITEELVVTPNDIVIGPEYVLIHLGRSMDMKSQAIEPERQKKIELDHKIDPSLDGQAHGFTSKRFGRKIGKSAAPPKTTQLLRKHPAKVPSRRLEVGLKQKKTSGVFLLHHLRFRRLKTSGHRKIHPRTQKIGTLTQSRAPRFLNTTKDLSAIPPQQGSTIAIQYSPTLLRVNQPNIKNIEVHHNPANRTVTGKVTERVQSLLWRVNNVRQRWIYLFGPLALILSLTVGIGLNST